MPAEPPTVQQQEVPAAYAAPVHHNVPVEQVEPVHHEVPVQQVEPVQHDVPVQHVEPAHHEVPADVDLHSHPGSHDAHAELHGGAGHHDDVEHHEDEAHHVYDDADVYLAGDHHPEHHYDEPGHPLIAAGSTMTVAPAKSKKVRRRRRWLALLLTLAVFVTALVVGAQFLKPLLGGNTVADFPGPGTGEVTVSVEPGEGTRSVATKLADQKVIANPDTFLHELTASGGTVAPGQFQFRQEMKNSDAVAVLLGKADAKVMYFALSAGLRVNESLQAIAEGSGIPVAELKALSDAPAQFGLPGKAKNLEGYLAPGEHRFPLGTSAKEILQNLVTTTVDELKAQGVTDPAKQYDVVTVASIVQAEGGQAEYGDVAGAIYNRLKPNNTETAGLIQSDATVTYGLGIKSFHIDEDQKADKSNPYNTYANQGLPVGPIGSPGKNAIDAAAKPKTNEYMYWVTINLDTKETKFSKTLAEHNVYVEQYNSWCAANAGRCT
nr:endolytic transglycosylase MltG [Arthrobacter sp. ISL-72]